VTPEHDGLNIWTESWTHQCFQ